MFNRTDIHTHYPWLAQRERRMIIGNDLDALLSAQFLQHTLGWSIAGFYNYTTLYVDPAIDPRECVWVDLDIHDPACCSIGHHILRPTPTDRIPGHRSSVNPNLLRGIDQTDFTPQVSARHHSLLAVAARCSYSQPPRRRAAVMAGRLDVDQCAALSSQCARMVD